MSVHLEGVVVSITAEEQVKIPEGGIEIIDWISENFGLKVYDLSPDFVRYFGGTKEDIRDKSFVLTSLKNSHHEREIFTNDPERQRRRILRVSEVLSILKPNYLSEALGTARFWAKGKDGELFFLGIRSEVRGLYVFAEKPANRLLTPRTITIRLKKA